MIEQFNRINRKVGANRMRLVAVTMGQMQFVIEGWGMFQFEADGTVKEIRELQVVETANSQWLGKLASGMVRDEDGNMLSRHEAFKRDAGEVVRKLDEFDRKMASDAPSSGRG